MGYRLAVAAFVLAGLLAACANDERPDERTIVRHTGRFEAAVVATEPAQARSLRATGAFDDDRHLFSIVTDFSAFIPDADGQVAIVATTDAMYIDWPYLTRLLGVTTRWIMVRGATSELLPSSIIDPRRLLDEVRGSDGLVQPTTMRFADGSSEGSALVSLEYFDLGAPVVIDPPAADQVTDETEVVNRLFGGTTGG
ncbi:MAG: hypothetical protein QOI95_2192 [Acidimicrobiaceae bacterium]|jgi:hypothetical protein